MLISACCLVVFSLLGLLGVLCNATISSHLASGLIRLGWGFNEILFSRGKKKKGSVEVVALDDWNERAFR